MKKDSLNPCAKEGVAPGFCYQETHSPWIYGRVAEWYDGGGYLVDLSYNADLAREQLSALRDAEWYATLAFCFLSCIDGARVRVLLIGLTCKRVRW